MFKKLVTKDEIEIGDLNLYLLPQLKLLSEDSLAVEVLEITSDSVIQVALKANACALLFCCIFGESDSENSLQTPWTVLRPRSTKQEELAKRPPADWKEKVVSLMEFACLPKGSEGMTIVW